MTLDDAIQLHETLEVTYCVDAYLAVLYTADRKTVALSVEGDTVEEALLRMKRRLAIFTNVSTLRELRD